MFCCNLSLWLFRGNSTQRTVVQNRLVIHTMASACQEMEILEKMDPKRESENRIIVTLIL